MTLIVQSNPDDKKAAKLLSKVCHHVRPIVEYRGWNHIDELYEINTCCDEQIQGDFSIDEFTNNTQYMIRMRDSLNSEMYTYEKILDNLLQQLALNDLDNYDKTLKEIRDDIRNIKEPKLLRTENININITTKYTVGIVKVLGKYSYRNNKNAIHNLLKSGNSYRYVWENDS